MSAIRQKRARSARPSAAGASTITTAVRAGWFTENATRR